MNIKSPLDQPGLEDFEASEGWLDKRKLTHGIREKQIPGDSLAESETTIE